MALIPPRRRLDDQRAVPFPVLMADIGGTNVRFALLTEAHSPVRHFPMVQTTDFPDFATAASETVLSATSVMPETLLLAMAAPVDNSRTKLTNADWVFDPQFLKDELGLSSVITFNDFEALAMALPALEHEHLVQVGHGTQRSRAPRVVIGPGTGLGVGALVYQGRRFMPVPGEGGHVDFGPVTERDFALWPLLEPLHGRISGEALLCGSGLVRLYRGLCQLHAADGGECTSGPDVTGAAAKGDPIAQEALDLFVEYLARLASDFALTLLARGGIYIGGGIAPQIKERFTTGHFRRVFERKAPHVAIVEDIPTFLITDERPAITGLAAFAVLPERYMMDLTDRRIGV